MAEKSMSHSTLEVVRNPQRSPPAYSPDIPSTRNPALDADRIGQQPPPSYAPRNGYGPQATQHATSPFYHPLAPRAFKPPPRPPTECEQAAVEAQRPPMARQKPIWEKYWWLMLLLFLCCVGAISGGVVGARNHINSVKSLAGMTAAASTVSSSQTSTPLPSMVIPSQSLTSATKSVPSAVAPSQSFTPPASMSSTSASSQSPTPSTTSVPSPASSATTSAGQAVYTAVYDQPFGGSGIGGYDLRSTVDQSFAFDYDHSGKLDHIVLYRPGTGTIWILKNEQGSFTPVYAQGDPGIGIGGYDLLSAYDRAFAFDYDHSGRLDHIALYRPGTGTMWVLKNSQGTFTSVYAQGDPGKGIGGYDLLSASDRAFAFDYDHSGKMDYLVLYRPGSGAVFILKNSNGEFTPIYAQGAPGSGIGGYDLLSGADKGFAFDYDHSGKNDHLCFYRPGSGAIFILKNSGGEFTPVYAQGAPGLGIGGFDLLGGGDSAFAFDYEGSGRQDYLVFYRPGSGILEIIKNNADDTFSPVYGVQNSGIGIAGFALKSTYDAAYAFDYSQTGKLDDVVLYEPGSGSLYIVVNSSISP